MAKSRIDEALAALAAAGDDGFGARRDVLERMSFDLLHRPALGGQIVAQLCAIETPSPKDEDLLDLLGAGLDAARIARENGKARGQPAEFAASISSRSKKAQGDWASGFSEALDRFQSAWPKKGMTKEDRKLIEIGAVGLSGADLPELAALIAKRQAKNSG